MYRKSFNILKNNMIFIQPLLLWQIVLALVSLFSVKRVQLLIPSIIMWCSVFLLFIACLSGWLYINKHAVLSYKDNETQDETAFKSINNLKKFFEGIGVNFLRTFIFSLVSILIYYVVFAGVFDLCTNYFGVPDFFGNIVQISQSATKEEMMKFFVNISQSDKLIFAKWVVTFNIAFSLVNFFVLLYFTIMIFERKNFLVSLFSSIKFFIVNIFEEIGIMIFVFILYLFINLLSVFLGVNSFLFALLIIIATMYFNYYVLLVFCFYYDKTKINSDNRTKLIG